MISFCCCQQLLIISVCFVVCVYLCLSVISRIMMLSDWVSLLKKDIMMDRWNADCAASTFVPFPKGVREWREREEEGYPAVQGKLATFLKLFFGRQRNANCFHIAMESHSTFIVSSRVTFRNK